MSSSKLSKRELRHRRHRRVRRYVAGTAARPRLAVCTTAKHIYVQLIDDDLGRTLASASTIDTSMRAANVKANIDGAKQLGTAIAEKAKALGVEAVVFDRGGFQYHGRIQVIADAAREAGLKF